MPSSRYRSITLGGVDIVFDEYEKYVELDAYVKSEVYTVQLELPEEWFEWTDKELALHARRVRRLEHFWALIEARSSSQFLEADKSSNTKVTKNEILIHSDFISLHRIIPTSGLWEVRVTTLEGEDCSSLVLDSERARQYCNPLCQDSCRMIGVHSLII